MTPLMMEFVPQKFRNDCGIAALSMLLNQPYRTVSETATALKVDWKQGMTDPDMIKVAREFGIVLKSRAVKSVRPLELPERTGLFSHHNHVVVVFEGMIYDPSIGMGYNVDAYIATMKRVRPCSMLVIKEQP
jgi:ABC-type bacteriocin/lantibiotic exporter with double-glycine peptidase domain